MQEVPAQFVSQNIVSGSQMEASAPNIKPIKQITAVFEVTRNEVLHPSLIFEFAFHL